MTKVYNYNFSDMNDRISKIQQEVHNLLRNPTKERHG